MSSEKIEPENIKRAIRGLKESVIENLKPGQILETYYEALQSLSLKLAPLTSTDVKRKDAGL